MRSTPIDDSTARARIRDAAVRLFGEQGYNATSVRQIADAAGVSGGLVIHHFGSKLELLEACDAHVLDDIMGRNSELSEGDLATTIQRWLADIDTYRPSIGYLGRRLLDGSDLGDAMFDNLVTRTEAMLAEGVAAGVMNPSSDPRMTAAIMASHGILPLLLERQLGRAVGEPGLTEALIRRMTIPSLELYTNGLYATDAMLTATRTALATTGRNTS